VDIIFASTTEPVIERVALDSVKEEGVLDPINCLLRTSDDSLRNFVVETFRQIVTIQQMALYYFEAVMGNVM
jgi:hypothetical protein